MSDDMKASKGLVFSVVARPGVGHMPAKVEDEQDPRGCVMWWLRGLRRGWRLDIVAID